MLHAFVLIFAHVAQFLERHCERVLRGRCVGNADPGTVARATRRLGMDRIGAFLRRVDDGAPESCLSFSFW